MKTKELIIKSNLSGEDLGNIDALDPKWVKCVIANYLSWKTDTRTGLRYKYERGERVESAGNLGLHYLLHGKQSQSELDKMRAAAPRFNAELRRMFPNLFDPDTGEYKQPIIIDDMEP